MKGKWKLVLRAEREKEALRVEREKEVLRA